jgi:hypothetical protein
MYIGIQNRLRSEPLIVDFFCIILLKKIRRKLAETSRVPAVAAKNIKNVV